MNLKKLSISHLIYVVYIFFIILLFRWVSFFELKNASDSIQGLLRSEYKQANSYLISKTLSDLESLKMIRCVILKEQGKINREYYNNSKQKYCFYKTPLNFLLVYETEFTAINGLKYQLIFQRPFNMTMIFLEMSCYIIGLLMIWLFREKKRTEEMIIAEKMRIAKQVAHDVRSPLTALNSMLKKVSLLIPEDDRNIIRSQVQRIGDIVDHLSAESRKQIQKKTRSHDLENHLLCAVLENIITEKRVEYRHHLGILIDLSLENSYGIFARINLPTFKRIISNLVNNAVEALDDNQGKVTISLLQKENQVAIIVEDNGKGIPENIIPKLAAEGVSFGKENHNTSGHGIGLFHCRQNVEKWGGQFFIESQLGKGSKINIVLPLYKVASWFLAKLEFEPKQAIVILDDSDGIHQIYKNRFLELNLGQHSIDVYHLTTPGDFDQWIDQYKGRYAKTTFLNDFELIGFNEDGLSLVEKHDLCGQTILVTSHYESATFREKCKQLGIKLIPKMLIGEVPMEITNMDAHTHLGMTQSPIKLYVHLDDDKWIRMNWIKKAREANENILSFESSTQLLNELQNIPLDAVFYIDSSLGENELKGEDVCKKLYDFGYVNLYMSTGFDSENFMHCYWLKGVIGKSSPWDSDDDW